MEWEIFSRALRSCRPTCVTPGSRHKEVRMQTKQQAQAGSTVGFDAVSHISLHRCGG
jgi:hypothetical protein